MFHSAFDRERTSLNGEWEYHIDQNDTGKRQSWYLNSVNNIGWKKIRVPHNWYLDHEIGDFFGTIWYKKAFTINEALRDKRIFLRFEGVDYITEAWINGQYLGFHEGMFNPFEFEITDFVDFQKENILMVRDAAL